MVYMKTKLSCIIENFKIKLNKNNYNFLNKYFDFSIDNTNSLFIPNKLKLRYGQGKYLGLYWYYWEFNDTFKQHLSHSIKYKDAIGIHIIPYYITDSILSDFNNKNAFPDYDKISGNIHCQIADQLQLVLVKKNQYGTFNHYRIGPGLIVDNNTKKININWYYQPKNNLLKITNNDMDDISQSLYNSIIDFLTIVDNDLFIS